MSPRTPAAAAVLVAVAMVAASCGQRPDYQIGPPPPTAVVSTVPAAVDSAGVSLAPVPAGMTTTTAVQVTPGPAAMGGVVNGPGGPVAGATVRLERRVANRSAFIDVLTGPDGRWAVGPTPAGQPASTAPGADGIVGGQYTVRAWKVPDLALLDPKPTTVVVGKPAQVDLTVNQVGGVLVVGDIQPDEPAMGTPVALAVQYTVRRVTDQGEVLEAPVPGAVVQGIAGSWQVLSRLPIATDGRGQAQFRLQCLAPGRQPLVVAIAGLNPAEVANPICRPPLPPTTPPAPVQSTTSSSTPTGPTGPSVPGGSTTIGSTPPGSTP